MRERDEATQVKGFECGSASHDPGRLSQGRIRQFEIDDSTSSSTQGFSEPDGSGEIISNGTSNQRAPSGIGQQAPIVRVRRRLNTVIENFYFSEIPSPDQVQGGLSDLQDRFDTYTWGYVDQTVPRPRSSSIDHPECRSPDGR